MYGFRFSGLFFSGGVSWFLRLLLFLRLLSVLSFRRLLCAGRCARCPVGWWRLFFRLSPPRVCSLAVGRSSFPPRVAVAPSAAWPLVGRFRSPCWWSSLVRAAVGFCGSRSLPVAYAPLVSSVVAGVVASGAPVVVGCASGSDQFVRAACPAASVLSVSSGAFGSGRGAFAARSVALVHQVAGAGGVLVGFVSSACPAGIVPAASWRSGASVSGSWSSLALATGLGCEVVIFWCGPGAPLLPVWGDWSAAVEPFRALGREPFGCASGRGWVCSPFAVQSSLF